MQERPAGALYCGRGASGNEYHRADRRLLPAATHDIELSYILEDCYTNYHFEEEIIDHDVLFNYQLKKGRATTRNAIRLLEMIGYDKKIVTEAQQAAQKFEKTGVWE